MLSECFIVLANIMKVQIMGVLTNIIYTSLSHICMYTHICIQRKYLALIIMSI